MQLRPEKRIQAEAASFREWHAGYRLPCALLYYASRLDLGLKHMTKQSAIVATLVASFAVWGVIEGVADNNFTKLGQTLSLLHAVLISALIFWWASVDSVERNYKLSTGWKFGLLLLGIVSMPFFLISNRPPERRALSVAKGFGLFLIASLLYAGTYVAATWRVA